MKRQKLSVKKRTVLGKKVRKLRKEGLLPGNIYGKDVKSQAVELPYKEFEKFFKEVGETKLIDVDVEGNLIPALIHNVQLDHLTRLPLHADFFQVNLKEKVKTMVPVVIVGEAKAVSDKLGLLLQQLGEIEVEALPEDLPENIGINVEHLAAVDEQITVSEIKAPKGVEILTDKEQVVVKIGELISKEAKEEAAKEAAAKAAAEQATVAETSAAGEGAKPAEEPKPQETTKSEGK